MVIVVFVIVVFIVIVVVGILSLLFLSNPFILRGAQSSPGRKSLCTDRRRALHPSRRTEPCEHDRFKTLKGTHKQLVDVTTMTINNSNNNEQSHDNNDN